MKRYRTIAWFDGDKVVLDTAGAWHLDWEEQEKRAVLMWTGYPQRVFDEYIQDHSRDNWWGIEIDWDEENEVVSA